MYFSSGWGVFENNWSYLWEVSTTFKKFYKVFKIWKIKNEKQCIPASKKVTSFSSSNMLLNSF